MYSVRPTCGHTWSWSKRFTAPTDLSPLKFSFSSLEINMLARELNAPASEQLWVSLPSYESCFNPSMTRCGQLPAGPWQKPPPSKKRAQSSLVVLQPTVTGMLGERGKPGPITAAMDSPRRKPWRSSHSLRERSGRSQAVLVLASAQ